MPITGPARASDNKQDGRLRKLELALGTFYQWRSYVARDQCSQVSRRIEAIVCPVSSFNEAIMSVGTLDLTNQNIVIDSYDSRDSNKSTNGLYDAAKRQENGDIATDGNIIDAGNAHIYGDVATNAGTVSGAANITGTNAPIFIRSQFRLAPSWSAFNATTTTVTNTATLTASATKGTAASRYELNTISLSGSKT